MSEIKSLIDAAVAAERERCAQIADSMESVQNIGDRIRYGLGHDASGRAKRLKNLQVVS